MLFGYCIWWRQGYCIWWRQLNKIRREIISSYKCLLNCYFNFSRTTFYFCISILQPITWGFPWVAYSIVYQFIMLFGVIALVSWVLFYFPGSSYIAGSQVGLDCVLAYQMLFLHNCISVWLILISVMLKRRFYQGSILANWTSPLLLHCVWTIGRQLQSGVSEKCLLFEWFEFPESHSMVGFSWMRLSVSCFRF